MSKHKPKSTRDEFMVRTNKMASVRDAAHYADMAGRHYAKDKITRLEAQMMIDAAVGSPWALFMAWCRHTLRTVTGMRRRMDARFAAEQQEKERIAAEVAEQLDPAMNDGRSQEIDDEDEALQAPLIASIDADDLTEIDREIMRDLAVRDKRSGIIRATR